MPSKAISTNLEKIINSNKIAVTGDSRFDQIIDRYNLNKDKTYLPNYFLDSFNIIFGSYDSYDEQLILESLYQFYPHGDQSLSKIKHRIILVPHEINMTSINQTINKLKKNNFYPILYSNLHTDNAKANVLIVDKIGILADIYKYCSLAYVGSGFNKGVHSVIEPGIYGCVVSFGPNISLLDEAIYIYKNKIGYMIHTKSDMCKFFELYKTENVIKNLGEKNKNYIINKKNSSNLIFNHIEQYL